MRPSVREVKNLVQASPENFPWDGAVKTYALDILSRVDEDGKFWVIRPYDREILLAGKRNWAEYSLSGLPQVEPSIAWSMGKLSINEKFFPNGEPLPFVEFQDMEETSLYKAEELILDIVRTVS